MTNVDSRPRAMEMQVTNDPLTEAYREGGSEITLVSIGNILLSHRWLLISLAILGYIVFAADAYRPYRTYTANTIFVSRSRSQQSLTTSVLSQLGIQSGGGGGGAYYIEIVRSPRILGPVVESSYAFQTDTGAVRGTLMQLYGYSGHSRRERAAAIARLTRDLKTANPPGGMMKVGVTSDYAALSALVARRILEELNHFNMSSRQEQASSERQFVEARVAEAKITRQMAEDALQAFINENQFFQPISPLALEWDRLKRDVSLKQELYTSLAKALDQAKIEEVRDNPVLTVIEPAEAPLGPDPTEWPRNAILGAIVGLFAGVIMAFIHAYMIRKQETYTEEIAELERLRAQAADDFRHPWRPLMNILATGRP